MRRVGQLALLCPRRHACSKSCELFKRAQSGHARLDDLRARLQVEDPIISNESCGEGQNRVPVETKRSRARDTDAHVAAALLRLSTGQFDEFWKKTVAFRDVPAQLFLSPTWQQRFSVSGNLMLRDFLIAEVSAAGGFADEAGAERFCEDVMRSLEFRPMKVKLTPYVLSRIDWSKPTTDPLRRQFIPMQSELQQDHPATMLDSLAERDSLSAAGPETGVVHRYPDKVLMLANSTCPVYCQYCTRSYAIGPKTGTVSKKHRYAHQRARWVSCVEYVSLTPAVRDVTISGGDASMLSGADLRFIGDRLLDIPHVQYVRIATKALAINPMKMYDGSWINAVVALHLKALSLGKEVFFHTHFQHAQEISQITEDCVHELRKHNITIRNQSVAIRGVNDSVGS
eukprot:INCI13913.2.p1 GENE.INCI13913.2~~INCI13913.2.p1  ORF type:complete len:449 (-),score=60.26 INCI13913.2:463-1659(-)